MEIVNNLSRLSSYLSVPYLKVLSFALGFLLVTTAIRQWSSVKSAGDWCSIVLCCVYFFLLENRRIIWQPYILEVVLKTAMPGSVRSFAKLIILGFSFCWNSVLLARAGLELLSWSDSSTSASQVVWNYRCHDYSQLSNTHILKKTSKFIK